MAEGLTVPERVAAAIASCRQEADSVGMFLAEYLVPADGNRLKTSELHQCYNAWAKANGSRAMNSPDFVAELRRRYEVKRDGAKGNVIVGFDIKK